VLRGQVDAIGDAEHPGVALVRLRVGGCVLLSRLTRRALAALGATVGRELWVQVKSVALLE
jgi:molybdate transport system ATP-binding protein